MQELVRVELDGPSDRYAVRHADTGQLICHQEGQEAANEVADLCSAKLALERGIPLDEVAFKHGDALQHIGPGAEDLRAMAWEALLQNLGCDGGGTLDAALRATQPMEEEGEGLGEEQEPATGISSSQPQDRPEAEAAEATAAAPGSPAGPAAGGAAAAVPQSPGTLKNCYKQGGSLVVQLALQGSNVYLGSFKGPEAAGMARDVACIWKAQQAGGQPESIPLNFPLRLYTADGDLMAQLHACSTVEQLKGAIKQRYWGEAAAATAAAAVAAAGMPVPRVAEPAAGDGGAPAAEGGGGAAPNRWKILDDHSASKVISKTDLTSHLGISELAWNAAFGASSSSSVRLHYSGGSGGTAIIPVDVVAEGSKPRRRFGKGWAAVVKALHLQVGDTLVLQRGGASAAAAEQRQQAEQQAHAAAAPPVVVASVTRKAAEAGNTPGSAAAAQSVAAAAAAGGKRTAHAAGLRSPGGSGKQQRVDTLLWKASELPSPQGKAEQQQQERRQQQQEPGQQQPPAAEQQQHPAVGGEQKQQVAPECQGGAGAAPAAPSSMPPPPPAQQQPQQPVPPQQQAPPECPSVAQQPHHSHSGTQTGPATAAGTAAGVGAAAAAAAAPGGGGADAFELYRQTKQALAACGASVELRHAYLQQVFMRLPYLEQRMHHEEIQDMQAEQSWALMRQFVDEEVARRRGGGAGNAGPADTSGGSAPGR